MIGVTIEIDFQHPDSDVEDRLDAESFDL